MVSKAESEAQEEGLSGLEGLLAVCREPAFILLDIRSDAVTAPRLSAAFRVLCDYKVD